MKNQNTVDIAGIEVSGLKRPREPPEEEKGQDGKAGKKRNRDFKFVVRK